MNTCKISNYCTETVHEITNCLKVRNLYYGISYGANEFALVCENCNTLTHGLESIPYFYMVHGGHLGRLSQGKKIRIACLILEKGMKGGSVTRRAPAGPSSGPVEEIEGPSSRPIEEIAGPYSGSVEEVAGPSSGPVSRKRAADPVLVHSKRARCSNQTVKKSLGGSHVVVRTDVSGDNSPLILVPQCLKDQLEIQISRMGQVKIQFGVEVEFTKVDCDVKSWITSNAAIPFSETFFEDGIEKLHEKLSKFSSESSGWTLVKILEIQMTLIKYEIIINRSGHGYIKTPDDLALKRCTINIKNTDQMCFLNSVMAIKHIHQVTRDTRCIPSAYDQFRHLYSYKDEWFPMKLANIGKFEAANPGLAIDVLMWRKEPIVRTVHYKHPKVEIVRRSKIDAPKIFLVLLEDGENYHYAAVKNLRSILNCEANVMGHRIQAVWCSTCLHGFSNEDALVLHEPTCKQNVDATTLYKMPKRLNCRFQDWSKTVKKPYVIYADFESLLVQDGPNIKRHEPLAAAGVLVHEGQKVEYASFDGEGCVVKFLEWADRMSRDIVYPWYDTHGKVPMLPLTPIQEGLHKLRHRCYLCHGYTPKPVRDHDHFTGLYIGPACNRCNLSRRVKPSLEIVFHNLKGYDMHHLLKYGFPSFPEWKFTAIPISTEKFLSVTAYTGSEVRKRKLVFIDSYQFLISSLSSLAELMPSFPMAELEFPSNIVKGKGLFPYDMATSVVAMEGVTELPPKWQDNIKDEDYRHARKVWRETGCRNLMDYMHVYLKLDVFILADVFEKFRIKSRSEDGLEPLNFFGIPGMTWASALKSLDPNHSIHLIRKDAMYKFFESAVRGGMTFVNVHHVRAHMNAEEILYVDANNLYGGAMSEKLPCGNFKWVVGYEEIVKMMTIVRAPGRGEFDKLNGDIGYTIEVDLEIPHEIHDKLSDLPVAPLNECPPGSKVKKLMLTHHPKKNYIVHAKLLRYWIKLGVKVTKVHRAIQYKQEYIFAKYIDSNTEKRKAATNKFDRNFYKLKNNALYGKTVENLKNRINMRMCTDEATLVTYASKPQFRRSICISENLVVVMLMKDEIVLDRPSYIGQTVLDLSKLRMYEFQYRDLERYRDADANQHIDIVAGDTDSFFLRLRNIGKDDLLDRMQADRLLDTSNYPEDHPRYSTRFASKLGCFKDEGMGDEYYEGYFLCPKMYSLMKVNQEELMKAKGMNLKDSIVTHQSYFQAYEYGDIISIPQERFETVNHQLLTRKSTKKALHCFDDKRHWVSKNVSLPYGHKDIV